MADPAPACPVRIGEPCRLCVPGASGPTDCGLVYLVYSDSRIAALLQLPTRSPDHDQVDS